ncbi:MAG TPA: hypothetical protein DCX53_14580 [Anaerolineae bacterium]|nr:hypothetical protein [Anaerolineae bacterium]
MKKNFIALTIAMLLSSCLPQDTQIPQSPLLPLLERKSGLIVYVGIDGNMYYSDQAGRSPTQITTDAHEPADASNSFRYYQFPTWSRDGNQVAFVGLSIEGDATTSDIFVHDLNLETTTKVYSSLTEFPFYINWSPDNANVGFIATTAQQNNIVLQSVPSGGGERTIIDTGSPYYWSWSPDGSVVIAHTGSQQTSSPDHFSFLRIDDEITEYGLDISPATFQAPAWSPDGSLIALTHASDKGNQIIVTDPAGLNQKTIGTFVSKTAFAWSFDSTRLAYLNALQTMANGTVGALHIYDINTETETVEDGDIIAFFWSPDGEKIAYYTLVPIPSNGAQTEATPQQYAVQLYILNLETGESKNIFSYRPTEQFLNILPYFDQYHQSTTIWSPDSNNLVISFLDGENNPGIAVVAASGQLAPRILAEGYIGFWSWE